MSSMWGTNQARRLLGYKMLRLVPLRLLSLYQEDGCPWRTPLHEPPLAKIAVRQLIPNSQTRKVRQKVAAKNKIKKITSVLSLIAEDKIDQRLL